MGKWMTSSMRGVGLAYAAMLVVAGTVAGDGHMRTVVEFDVEQGDFPEGVARPAMATSSRASRARGG